MHIIMDNPLTAFATRLHIYPTTWSELIDSSIKQEASSTCSGKTGGDGWFRTTQLRLDIAAQSCWDSAASFVATAQGYLGTWWVWDWKFIIYNKKFITVNLPHSKFYWNWWENPLVTLSVTTCCTWDKGMLRSLLLSSVFRLTINN